MRASHVLGVLALSGLSGLSGCSLDLERLYADAATRDAGPSGDAPGLDAPGLDAPGLDAPGLDAPMLDAPMLDAALDAPALPDAFDPTALREVALLTAPTAISVQQLATLRLTSGVAIVGAGVAPGRAWYGRIEGDPCGSHGDLSVTDEDVETATVADLENDGSEELVTSLGGIGHVISTRSGTMSFTHGVFGARAIAVFELTGDSRLDVVVAGASLVEIDGATLRSVPLATGAGGDATQDLAALDEDGDGLGDVLALRCPSPTHCRVEEWMGTAGTPRRLTRRDPAVTVGDVLAMATGEVISSAELPALGPEWIGVELGAVWLATTGGVRLAAPVRNALDEDLVDVVVADVDGDGETEAVVIGQRTSDVLVLDVSMPTSSTYAVSVRTRVHLSELPEALAAGDVNGDGHDELFVGGASGIRVLTTRCGA
ncbi:MAG: hypothetical protein U0353_06235 [Sandaracinus sp.]